MARPVFIERGRGEGVTSVAINGGGINGERVGEKEMVALMLHNAEETNGRARGTTRSWARGVGVRWGTRRAAAWARGGVARPGGG
jgi:hypothetical protein